MSLSANESVSPLITSSVLWPGLQQCQTLQGMWGWKLGNISVAMKYFQQDFQSSQSTNISSFSISFELQFAQIGSVASVRELVDIKRPFPHNPCLVTVQPEDSSNVTLACLAGDGRGTGSDRSVSCPMLTRGTSWRGGGPAREAGPSWPSTSGSPSALPLHNLRPSWWLTIRYIRTQEHSQLSCLF